MPLQTITNSAVHSDSPVASKRTGSRREWRLAKESKEPEREVADDPAVLALEEDVASLMVGPATPPMSPLLATFAALPASPEMLEIVCAGEWAESRRERDTCGVKQLMRSVGLEQYAAAAIVAGHVDLQPVLQMSSSREQLEHFARSLGMGREEQQRLVDGFLSPAESSSC